MSRVSYLMLNPESRKELTRVVRGCLAKLTAELAKEAGIDRHDVLEVTVVGNPIMHHLLLGLDPTELGGAPFALAIEDSLRLPASDLALPDSPRRPRVRPPLHRRSRGRGYRRNDSLRSPVSRRRGQPPGRRGDERRDRAREQGPAARGLEPDRPGFRGRADHLRPASRARRDRARADRCGDARAPVPGDRHRRLVGRARLRRARA